MRTRTVGDHALLVLVDDAVMALDLARWVRETRVGASLPAGPGRPGPAAPRDVVPAARTVLLDGLPNRAAVEDWRSWLASWQPGQAPSSDAPGCDVASGRRIVIETTYDGADLGEVARAWGCTEDDLVKRHQAAEFVVAFCGFAPGFAYCLPTEPLPEVPRRVVPRERVPAGSVALGGAYCGVYPRTMPGGWQLVGSTTAPVFDATRDRPALLTPGDRVQFRAVQLPARR